jgi:hypothetical protein
MTYTFHVVVERDAHQGRAYCPAFESYEARAVPPGYFPPKTYCAAVIAEAWSFVHGVEPAPKNQKAAAAAHLLWRESLEGLSMEET